MTDASATDHPTDDPVPTEPAPEPDPVGGPVAASAVQDVLDAAPWPDRPDVWTRVERDRALPRSAQLKVLVTDHGCVVARTPAHAIAGADAGRERWPPSPAAA